MRFHSSICVTTMRGRFVRSRQSLGAVRRVPGIDRKSTRLNSSHLVISYAVFCLKKKNMPIAVRYTQDAFSRSGWLWPVVAKGEPLKATSYMAGAIYVAASVYEKFPTGLAAQGLI